MKIKFIIFFMLIVFFIGCEDKIEPTNSDTSEAISADIPISSPDANVSIDENLPPEPVIGG